MKIVLVAALDRNGLIGRGDTLPWRLPADLRHFKALTLGKPVLMGRRTFESIGRPLPGRRNLVLSRDPDFHPEGVIVVPDLAAARAAAGDAEELMVIGGANVYAQLLDLADRMELTEIDHAFEGDVYFPAFDRNAWKVVKVETHAPDAENPWPYRFLTLERRRPAPSTFGDD